MRTPVSRGWSYPIRPTSILLSRSDLATIVEQDLADITPDCVRPVESDRVETLNLDTARATSAFDPEQFARDLRQSHLLDGQPGFSGGARVAENGFPVFQR
jgi:hypothetical protein